VHRDVKAGNVLISSSGDVRLADFGHATEYAFIAADAADATNGPLTFRPLSPQAFTRHCRPPEVLLSGQYGSSADIWAFGCVLAELLAQKPPFPGAGSDVLQLALLASYYGDLEALWPGVAHARDWGKIAFAPSVSLAQARENMSPAGISRQFCSNASLEACEVVSRCLRANPEERATAAELLALPWFQAGTSRSADSAARAEALVRLKASCALATRGS
jgi:serine/threonine protein kinase